MPADLADPIAGDLHEEYLAMRERRGAARADLWIWAQSLRLAVTASMGTALRMAGCAADR